MNTTVARMSKNELKKMIEITIEQKLLELLGDPDEGLEMKKSMKARLLRQIKSVKKGERGESIDTTLRRLKLK
jgi:hypothetical protein